MRLSPHCQLLLQEFRDKRQELLQLDNHVFELISQTLKQQGIELNSIEPHKDRGVAGRQA